MNINVYDFDNTIYKGDSTVKFFFYCLRKHPNIIKIIPTQFTALFKYIFKIYNKVEFKQRFFAFLRLLKNVDNDVNGFWSLNTKNIKDWYTLKIHSDDVIISASPEFLLLPICNMLQVKALIASNVDKKTGKFTGENCYGCNKVSRLNEFYHSDNYTISEFYSDSLSDEPLAKLAKKSYLVKHSKITDWPYR